MTRVEKFREYRRKIANMKLESFSSKKEAFEQVEKIRETKQNSAYDYDDLMEVHDIYDTFGDNVKKKHSIRIRKDQIVYVSIAIFIIAIIIIGIVLVGIKIWGN